MRVGGKAQARQHRNTECVSSLKHNCVPLRIRLGCRISAPWSIPLDPRNIACWLRFGSFLRGAPTYIEDRIKEIW